jgi:hypothetical protein
MKRFPLLKILLNYKAKDWLYHCIDQKGEKKCQIIYVLFIQLNPEAISCHLIVDNTKYEFSVDTRNELFANMSFQPNILVCGSNLIKFEQFHSRQCTLLFYTKGCQL